MKNGIDVSALENGKWYYVMWDAGRTRPMIWSSFLDSFAINGFAMRSQTVTQVRGPIDFDSLPLVTQASE